jgi:putative membrane protein
VVGETRSSPGPSGILNILVLSIWAGAFLFLINGERYRYFLGPAFGVSLMAGLAPSAALCVALGKRKYGGTTVSRTTSAVRAFILLLPLIYAALTGGAVLDNHSFQKRLAGGRLSVARPQGEGSPANAPDMTETEDDDSGQLVEAYRKSGPPQVPRGLRKMLGMTSSAKTFPDKSGAGIAKGVLEADLYDLNEFHDRFRGSRVVTEGMVAWDENGKDRFYLFRFVVVCCVADAQAIAVLVENGETGRPRQNSWVRVEGLADTIEVAGQTGVIVRKALVSPIAVPKDPYLY